MPVQIQFRRGTAAEWTAADPILALAEMGIETDTGKFKVGDGVSAWTARPYGGIQGPQGIQGDVGPQGGPQPVVVLDTIDDYPGSPDPGTFYVVRA